MTDTAEAIPLLDLACPSCGYALDAAGVWFETIELVCDSHFVDIGTGTIAFDTANTEWSETRESYFRCGNCDHHLPMDNDGETVLPRSREDFKSAYDEGDGDG